MKKFIPFTILILLYASVVYAALTYTRAEIDTLLSQVNAAVNSSAGAGDAGKLIELDSSGLIDVSFLGSIPLDSDFGSAGIMYSTDGAGSYGVVTTVDLAISAGAENDFVTLDSNKKLTSKTPANALSSMTSAAADYSGTTTLTGIDNLSSAWMYYKTIDDQTCVDFRFVGQEAGTAVSFTLPSTRIDTTTSGMFWIYATDGENGAAYSHCLAPANGTTVNCYPTIAQGAWNADNDQTRIIIGQFCYFD